MDIFIDAHKLHKRFGDLIAVQNVSFQVRRGEVLGFLGPNGAGKTTTMKMLTGFLAPTSGHAEICGLSVTKGSLEARRMIGYLPEGAPLYGEMTTRAFLDFIADTHQIENERRAQAIEHAVSVLHLSKVMEQRIETLSKGFRRRVGLAAAILHEPRVLILDEPTDGLDPNQKHDVRRLIEEMSADRAIIISTHILEEVEALCSRAMIINSGRVIADTTPSELKGRSRYRNSVTMLVPIEKSDEVVDALKKVPGVSSVEHTPEGDRCRLTALSRDQYDISSRVAAAAEHGHWDISQFAVDSGRLEDVFRQLTVGDPT